MPGQEVVGMQRNLNTLAFCSDLVACPRLKTTRTTDQASSSSDMGGARQMSLEHLEQITKLTSQETLRPGGI